MFVATIVCCIDFVTETILDIKAIAICPATKYKSKFRLILFTIKLINQFNNV